LHDDRNRLRNNLGTTYLGHKAVGQILSQPYCWHIPLTKMKHQEKQRVKSMPLYRKDGVNTWKGKRH